MSSDYDAIVIGGGAPASTVPARSPRAAFESPSSNAPWSVACARTGPAFHRSRGAGGRKISRELGIASAATAAIPPFTAALALELAPIRVNLIAAGFVDTPLSASYFSAEGLEARREELLPIRRVVGPADVAALAAHLMTNTALTGATSDIDGGQQFAS
jgi:NAD(P)-dependent dehydrogenase (short-subunit alcohol dehydrogenase family)